MKKIKINVTKNDIKNGVKLHGGRCPIALAMRRKIKNFETVDRLEVVIGGKRLQTPPRIEEFIRKFDHNIKVNASSFFIEVPKRYLINDR